MDPKAAQAQALFADQIDGQLTQGSAAQIHSLANAPVTLPVHPALGQSPVQTATYDAAQYTPSAQEAATGAYSAQKQQQTKAQPAHPSTQPASQPQPPSNAAPAQPIQAKKGKRKPAPTESVPTLVTAPGEQNPSQVTVPQNPTQTAAPEVPVPANPGNVTTNGVSDDELQQQNLPPLRGPWVRVQREKRVISPREEAETQLQTLESGYSPWMGGTGVINYRSGDLGYDHLSALEAPFEMSMPLGYNARLTVVAKPVFLDSGQADGTSIITVQEATTSGTCLVTIPHPAGNRHQYRARPGPHPHAALLERQPLPRRLPSRTPPAWAAKCNWRFRIWHWRQATHPTDCWSRTSPAAPTGVPAMVHSRSASCATQ